MQAPAPDEWLDRATHARRAGKPEESDQLCRQILLLFPGHAPALNLLGILAAEAGDAGIAAGLFHRAILMDSTPAEYHSNLANVLRALRDTDGAIAAYRAALARNPNLAEVHSNLGCALLPKGELAGAAAALRQAIALKPRLAEAHSNLANALLELGEPEPAIAAYRTAIALGTVAQKDRAEILCNLGMALLLTGQFDEGWQHYESRLQSAGGVRAHQFPQTRWNGEPLAGKTILLYAEQGFGDTIQFIRYLPRVCERGGSVIVACQRPLLRLFTRLPDASLCVAEDQPLPPFDVHCPLLSLPLVFKTTPETIPPQVPRLSPPPELSGIWAQKIATGGFKVGLTWAGSTAAHQYARCPIPLPLLAPLSKIAGIQFFSLQKGAGAAEAPEFPGLIDLTAVLADFADTAALIENLDLVISVDSAVAHLAGSMNKAVWTLLPFAADWRWGVSGESTPWYPSMRLFRQTTPGDWFTVAGCVKKELQHLLNI